MSKRSAGILLFSVRDNALSVLLVHPGGPFWKNKDSGAWSIPKGEFLPEEDPRTAALREFHEETGLRLSTQDLIDLGEITQQNRKIVSAWAAEGDFDVTKLTSNEFDIEWPPRSGRRQSFPEVDAAQWCDPATACDKIIPAQAAFIDRLTEILTHQGRI